MKERIRNCLAALEPRHFSNGFTREAAVLIPVIRSGDGHFLLLTRRTEHVQTHKGQISFPGGMREGKESLLQTALRETYEEVGIEAHRIEILGRFHDYISINGYRVTPFAGFIEAPVTTVPQEHEVAEVLHVPFDVFLDPAKLRKEKTVFRDKEVNVYFFSYGSNQIWGLTARIIKEFMETLDLE